MTVEEFRVVLKDSLTVILGKEILILLDACCVDRGALVDYLKLEIPVVLQVANGIVQGLEDAAANRVTPMHQVDPTL